MSKRSPEFDFDLISKRVCVEAFKVTHINAWRTGVVSRHSGKEIDIAIIFFDIGIRVPRFWIGCGNRLVPKDGLRIYDNTHVTTGAIKGECRPPFNAHFSLTEDSIEAIALIILT